MFRESFLLKALLKTLASHFACVKAIGWAAVAASVCLLAATTFAPAKADESARAVTEGQKAPDFSLPDIHGKKVSLSDYKGKRFVIFFYDADFTPVSAAQAKQQEKDYKKYKLQNTDVLCIGPDPLVSHKAMKTPASLKLKYHLLTDKNDAVRSAYGFPQAQKGQHNHYALVVDKDLTVKRVVGGDGSSNEESMEKALRYLGDFEISAY
jgi:peroxiredoxin Q/BCP